MAVASGNPAIPIVDSQLCFLVTADFPSALDGLLLGFMVA